MSTLITALWDTISPSLTLSTLLVACVVFVLATLLLPSLDRRRLPPGPRGVPLYGNLLDIRKAERSGPGIFTEWAEVYGDLYSVRLGAYRAVVLSNQTLLREAFLKHGEVTSGRPSNVLFFRLIGINGIVFNEGDRWRTARRGALHAMRDFGMGKKSLEGRIQQEASALVEAFDKANGQPVNPKRLLHNAFINVICSIIFGDRFDYDDPDFQMISDVICRIAELGGFKNPEMFVPVLTPLIPLLNTDLFTLSKSLNQTRSYILKRIEQHKEVFDPEITSSFLDIYLKASLSEDATKRGMKDYLISIEDLFLAGAETSTTSLTWMILYLVHYPEVQAECQRLIREVIGPSRLATNEDRARLRYVEAAICEQQRIASIATYGVLHRTTEDISLGGYSIPRDTLLLSNLQKLHMDRDYWGDPDVFRPERWIAEDGSLIKHDNYYPFSTGPRECLGKSMAMQEMFIVLVSLLQRFTFSALDPDKPPSLRGHMGFVYSASPYRIIATKT